MKRILSSLSFLAGIPITIVLMVAWATSSLSLPSVAEAHQVHRGPISSAISQLKCPSAEEMAPLLALGSVYLGEVHGTNQSPKLVECLVDATLASGVKPLVVSLELPSFARNTESLTWSGVDGRTSKAMAELVEHLETLERAHRIILDFQVTGYEASDEVINREIGIHLKDLAAKSRVIALGGNFHSQRRNVLQPSTHVRPAGSYVGVAIKTVFVDSAGRGHAWFCSNTCGKHATSNAVPDGHVGQLMDGADVGHDYVYKVAPFTSSAPAVERPTRVGS